MPQVLHRLSRQRGEVTMPGMWRRRRTTYHPMTEHFNKLTEPELERLSLLAEECAEVIQVIGKILRHGYESYSPFDEAMTSNRALLEKEVGHVQCAVALMAVHDICGSKINNSAEEKAKSVRRYLHHQQ